MIKLINPDNIYFDMNCDLLGYLFTCSKLVIVTPEQCVKSVQRYE